MVLYNSVKIIDHGFFQHSRCFLETFDAENDINPVSQRAGIRSHCWITALFLKLLGKIEEINTSDGKTVYLNRESFKQWRLRHAANLPEQTPFLPSAATIIEYRKKILKEKEKVTSIPNPQNSSSKTETTTVSEPSFDEEGDKVSSDDAMKSNNTQSSISMETSCESDVEMSSKDSEEDNKIVLFETDHVVSLPDPEDESHSQEGKALNLAKKWGLKLAPEVFPELKAPLQILKSGTVLKDAYDNYQSGDTLGALKKVAPMAVGGGLLLMGGPTAAAAFGAYKMYTLANLIYDTATYFSDSNQPLEEPMIEEAESLYIS